MQLLLDHASHQGHIDMARLKAEGHVAEIGKATGEGDYFNPYYWPNHNRALAAGMITGSYDWVEPQDPRSPEWLAEDYLRTIDPRPPGHLLTVDFETPDWFTGPRGRDIQDFMYRYIQTLLAKGRQPVGLYSAPYFLAETGADRWDWLARDCYYWMAAPGNATGPFNQRPDNDAWQAPLGRPWSVVTIHQHQWYAQSDAIGSGANFDRDRFNGTLDQLRRLGYGGSIGKAEVISGGLAKGETKEEVKGGEVQEPPAGKYTAYINAAGETIVALNFGGKTKRIDGVNIKDIGVSVESDSEPGVLEDRSFQDQEAKLWMERR